jgi:mannose-1-phosphate guanylyltransferase
MAPCSLLVLAVAGCEQSSPAAMPRHDVGATTRCRPRQRRAHAIVVWTFARSRLFSPEAFGIAFARSDAMLKALRSPPFNSTPDIVTGSGSPRLLVVGADPAVRAVFRQQPQSEQLSVVVVATVEDAIRAADRMPFDVVASLPTAAPAAALVRALRALVAQPLTLHEADASAGNAPAQGPRPTAQGLLRIVVHAGRGGRLRHVLNALAPAVGAERITVVALWRDAKSVETVIASLPSRPEVLLQPRDRGSAAAVLLAAYAIRRSDPDATLVSIPAGRGLIPGPMFVDTVEETGRFVNHHPRWIVLLGERPRRGTPGSWIVPDAVLDCSSIAPVRRVVVLQRGTRPPTPAGVGAAFRATGVVVAKAARLVGRARQLLPGVHSALLDAVPFIGGEAEIRALHRAYAVIPRRDFTMAMLEPSVNDLAVAEPTDATWLRVLQLVRGVR